MTKREVIEGYVKEGNGAKEIQKLTDYSLTYVRQVIWGLRNPKAAEEIHRKYNSSERGRSRHREAEKLRPKRKRDIKRIVQQNQKRREENPEQYKAQKRQQLDRNNSETIPRAINRHQEWTMREITYIET